jgi:hypothetical protein
MCTDQDAGSAKACSRGCTRASARHEDGVGSGVDAPLVKHWHPLNRVKERR